MKIRTGFVSNSSSSSFTCDVCGENVSGMDMGLKSAEMYSCGRHYWCYTHSDPSASWEDIDTYEKALNFLSAIDSKTWVSKCFKEQLDKLSEDQKKDSYLIRNAVDYIAGDIRSEVSKSLCPVCTLKIITPEIESLYLRFKDGRLRKELHEVIRLDYNNLDRLIEAIKGAKVEL
jgi:hypothetical protein